MTLKTTPGAVYKQSLLR